MEVQLNNITTVLASQYFIHLVMSYKHKIEKERNRKICPHSLMSVGFIGICRIEDNIFTDN